MRRREVLAESRKFDVPGEIGCIRKGLLRSQKSCICCRDALERETSAVVSMLQDDPDAVVGRRKLVQDAFVKEWKSVISRCFSCQEQDHWTAWLVVAGIEPVAVIEGPIAVRLVPA